GMISADAMFGSIHDTDSQQ
ncbi:hypothetical protein PC113_g1765, partial [Phytophthora cactorum]